jgi:predicted dehydrogenase
MARGTIGWPSYPRRAPSTIEWTTIRLGDTWVSPAWTESWFPDAFAGPMAELLCALENHCQPELSGDDNLKTMALVDACYLSAREHRAVSPAETL